MTASIAPPPGPSGLAASARSHEADLRAAARALEGAFLSEMLKSAGFATPRGAFGGGAGEEQFAGMLRDLQARDLAESGGIGLAEAIYRSLTEAGDGA